VTGVIGSGSTPRSMRRRIAALVFGGFVVLLIVALGIGRAVGSQVSSVSVSISPTTAGVASTYTVSFTATTTLLPVTGTITLFLFLIYVLDHPFTRPSKVSPEPLKEVIGVMQKE